MGDGYMHYLLYRDANSTNDQIIQSIIEETKNYVFEDGGLVLTSQGYSGVPLTGRWALTTRRDDLWKTIDVLFKLTNQFEGLIFSISTDDPSQNLFYRECERNEVIPKWISSAADMNGKVFGCGGVLHMVSPETKAKHPGVLDIDIIRKQSRETRNILITEAVKQRISLSARREFGMQRTSVNVPEELAYIARQRPDLLSSAVREYFKSDLDHTVTERRLECMNCVMVHVYLNSRDWKAVTAVADIECPSDIVSHRVSCALIEFDDKYTCYQNGVLDDDASSFKHVPDLFERERLCSLQASMTGSPQSLGHQFQMAKSFLTSKHLSECKRLFSEGMSSSTDNHTACSGDDEDDHRREREKKQVFTKKRGDFGKKRTLAAIRPANLLTSLPAPDEFPTPTSSGQLRNFERAVNGDDVYKESSDERSLGEEEEMDLFVVKPKKKLVAKPPTPCMQLSDAVPPSDDDNGFDVSDLIHAVPPLACNDEFDDFDV